eukprot:6191429-Pleurochrysis_carterae.AAC.1
MRVARDERPEGYTVTWLLEEPALGDCPLHPTASRPADATCPRQLRYPSTYHILDCPAAGPTVAPPFCRYCLQQSQQRASPCNLLVRVVAEVIKRQTGQVGNGHAFPVAVFELAAHKGHLRAVYVSTPTAVLPQLILSFCPARGAHASCATGCAVGCMRAVLRACRLLCRALAPCAYACARAEGTRAHPSRTHWARLQISVFTFTCASVPGVRTRLLRAPEVLPQSFTVVLSVCARCACVRAWALTQQPSLSHSHHPRLCSRSHRLRPAGAHRLQLYARRVTDA